MQETRKNKKIFRHKIEKYTIYIFQIDSLVLLFYQVSIRGRLFNEYLLLKEIGMTHSKELE